MLDEIMRLAKVDAREGDAMHALMHCENEQACTRCNPAPQGWQSVEGGPSFNGYADAEQAAHYAPNEPPQKPSDIQVDGPRSCENYWQSCSCALCNTRDEWYRTTAT